MERAPSVRASLGLYERAQSNALIGKKKEGDFETDVIVKTYEKMINDIYPKDKVVFSTFSTFSTYIVYHITKKPRNKETLIITPF